MSMDYIRSNSLLHQKHKQKKKKKKKNFDWNPVLLKRFGFFWYFGVFLFLVFCFFLAFCCSGFQIYSSLSHNLHLV